VFVIHDRIKKKPKKKVIRGMLIHARRKANGVSEKCTGRAIKMGRHRKRSRLVFVSRFDRERRVVLRCDSWRRPTQADISSAFAALPTPFDISSAVEELLKLCEDDSPFYIATDGNEELLL
jgi:hypothetical protein